MYLEHFGLKEFPFSITPGTHFFFPSASSIEAFNTLMVAIMMGEGFIKVTGEVGTGKTMLCRKLMAALGKDFAIAYILNPYLEPMALFAELLKELGQEPRHFEEKNQHQLVDELTRLVIALNQSGKRVVICLDEVQAMPTETLEALRLLTNLETEQRKLLQVLIFGQPELEQRLNHSSVRQLRQRITFHYRLKPLTDSEFNSYIEHRLRVAGCAGGQVFSPKALSELKRLSRCIPRLANILANKALLSAFGKGRTVVYHNDVIRAAEDTESVGFKRYGNQTTQIAGVFALIGLVVTSIVWIYWL